MKTFKVPYSVVNGGDGSAYPQFFQSMSDANKHQEYQQEHYEGWGESCTGYFTFTIHDDGKITSELYKFVEPDPEEEYPDVVEKETFVLLPVGTGGS